jgi:hypothetical protein
MDDEMILLPSSEGVTTAAAARVALLEMNWRRDSIVIDFYLR